MTAGGPARLDAELVRRGLARSRGRASELVAQGRVRVAGQVAEKPSRPVLDTDPLEVEPDEAVDYVSRAAHKLVGALDGIAAVSDDGPRVEGARCLDVGASTGGFTQVLLARGARQVVALDVGHGQLSADLAANPRVVSVEGTNVRTVHPPDVGGPADVVVVDLSFISLTMVAEQLLALTSPTGHLVVMVKPQFEVGRERLAATGVVTSPALRQESVLAVAAAVERAGGAVEAVIASPLPGPSGNHEYFLWVRHGSADGGKHRPAVRTGDRVGRQPLADAVAAAVTGGSPSLVATVGAR
jgi:23S rRNA (cytidine1920-2'-O)/16S rRNA (cytidine1409-2'-O)-methyltransferase